jgi:uncharacterized protein (TIGR02001 family)
MKKVIGTALAAGAAMLGATAATTATANAEAAWSFNVGLATDYIFRGLDATPALGVDDGGAQVFGGADLSVGSFYAGAWVSNVGYSYDQSVEYDLYAGFKPTLGPVTLDLGAIYYGYKDGEIFDYSDGNTIELKAAASIPAGGATLGAAVYWTPDYLGDANGVDDDDSFYVEGNAAYTFGNKATLSGAVGVVMLDDTVYAPDSYTTANIGVSFPITDNLSIDGRYIVNNEDAIDLFGPGVAADSLVGTIKATF